MDGEGEKMPTPFDGLYMALKEASQDTTSTDAAGTNFDWGAFYNLA